MLARMTDVLSIADAQSSEIVRLRRDFHQHPELSFVEHRTSECIHEYLSGLGLEVVRNDTTGMWADLETPGAEKCIAFRADMDALAMDEVAGPHKAEFLSVNAGAAHCCGHDTHMAMLLAAAKVLASGEAPRKHKIRFLFQHAEEKSPGGAIDLIEQGCLEGVDEVYGLHVIPPIPGGKFSVAAGPFMAAADELRIRIRGEGGHAAFPHLITDPIVAASHVVTGLQSLVSRRTSPLDSLVVSISTMRGGSGTTNVIPDEVELLGTVRTLSPELHERAPSWVEELVRNTARAHGCEAEVDYERGYPVLINDEMATDNARRAIDTLFGADGFADSHEPWMGGEDFARYAQQRPACYLFLGVGSDAKGITAPNHATDFDVDEEALWRGTAWFLQLAQQ